ncbi:expressed unknown protein [Seminavis robusta]|uniref:Uncharacterized protein n=1 Tax=Seminavis robusta TaxID=568900 RepID=A0A9N8EPK7_9STRA|nr:expressed unknown protein [Seminavis robusta]|eukprot:Sro1541_g280940.1 n/a (885) ;mRNA; r:18168-21087
MFTNQTTNLTTLSKALTSLCREFDAVSTLESIASPGDSCRDKESQIHEAEGFLDTLAKRVDDVDDALMKSTEHLLPTLSGGGGPSRMTATELSQILTSLHAIHSQQIKRIEALLAGSPASASDATLDETRVITPYHWSLGLPLDKVEEMDNETDRYSFGSAASSLRSGPRTPFSQRGPGTPSTPSLRDLHLSATTTSILTQDFDTPNRKKMAQQNNNLSAKMSASPDAASDNESRNPIQNTSNSENGLDAIRNYHSGSMSHPDDDDDENSTQQKDNASTDYLRMLHDDEDDDSVDESTLCPTVIAEDRKPKSVEEKGGHVANEEETHSGAKALATHKEPNFNCSYSAFSQIFRTQNQQSTLLVEASGEAEAKDTVLSPEIDVTRNKIFRPNQHDISHVVVQTDDGSPSQTLLTMDGSMFLHDADAVSHRSRRISDAASLGDETPVLDRYRIISDDNSIGFKVLPNERGSHRKTLSAKRSETNGVPKTVKFRGDSVEGNGDHPAFRKTPYPARNDLGLTSVTSDTSRIAQSKPISSPFRFENGKENQGTALSSPFHTGGRNSERRSFGKSVAFNVQFQSPATSTKGSFRKTPFKSGPPEPTSSSKPHSGVRFDVRTPSKGITKVYRKTPLAKITERESMESLKFPDDNSGQGVRFEGDPLSSSTPISKGVTFRKTPYRRSVANVDGEDDDNLDDTKDQMKSPRAEMPPGMVASSTPKTIRFAVDATTSMSSPMSFASDITGFTAISYSEHQRELFPRVESLEEEKKEEATSRTPRKSASSLIAKVSQEEFEQASPLVKLQFSREETNKAITALNGAAFLRKSAGDSFMQFTDAEAYKILRNYGFKRRRCKGLLMSLCHWQRLAMHQELDEETDFGLASIYFEIVQ